jgi:hypothetical protein
MKTTVEISDALLRTAKSAAAARNMTLRMIIEAALCRYLEATAGEAHARPRLRRHSFRGRGLRPSLSESDWVTIRELVYESRGG